jgi:hypothetical protein
VELLETSRPTIVMSLHVLKFTKRKFQAAYVRLHFVANNNDAYLASSLWAMNKFIRTQLSVVYDARLKNRGGHHLTT